MPKDRVCATDTALPVTRRAALTGAAALAASLPPASSVMAGASEDPILPLYREWVQARKDWYALADLPGNEDWDSPETIEAQDREDRAFWALCDLTPCSMEGVAALAHVLWVLDGPSVVPTHPEYADQCAWPENRLLAAIWRAGSGQTGLPGAA
ncbi:hypothetical protein RGUI_0183 [Rhodovulum sp. P5]|uniref:hypothetical protein n=1 Tax=Rhodovulum sp. P5 TaxID=1564506 RepID=UPI0009C1B10F|nr:hypothetical protein [Rhodovulum sp. P5]ARE38324.1 hypothetical protein RGUI_0183 [Rhodovulum sp. P5]